MDKKAIQDILSSPFVLTYWQNLLKDVFGVKKILQKPVEISLPSNNKADAAYELGSFNTADDRIIGLYLVKLKPEVWLERNKVGLRELLRSVYRDAVDGALIVFEQEDKWRLSFVSEIRTFDNEGNIIKQVTAPKRYTYLLGKDEKTKTPVDRLFSIAGKKLYLKEILDVFSVETLTKEFYNELSNWYFWALQNVEFPNDLQQDKEVNTSTSVIRLITRLMFVWFLKQKKLIADELFDTRELEKILNYSDKTGSTFYKAILQNLFFATLNTEMGEKRKFVNRQSGIQGFYRYERFFKNKERFIELTKDKTPFLNGGLFENLDKNVGEENEIRIDCFSNRIDKEKLLKVPDFLFFGEEKQVDLNKIYDTKGKTYKVRGLIDILKTYNFTIEENTTTDIEVALDPELLGKVFENLLASFNPETQTTARKQTGSFYTPREIVDYMVDESLKAYLREKVGDDWENNAQTISALNEIKILDPACGSGAFPMGILQKMVQILQKLDPENEHWKQRQLDIANKIEDVQARETAVANIEEAFENNELDYGRKLFLIESSIFGIDIQPIAVQISKLRFFISLICEQTPNPEKPNLGIRPLPNLETKFVAANTLVGLDKPKQRVLGMDVVEPLEKELAEVRHKHFSARTPETKRKYREKDGELRHQIAEKLKEIGFNNNTAEKVAQWNPYDQNDYAGWFDAEWMFGLTQENAPLAQPKTGGGYFDVVIGNPPYGATLGASDKNYFQKNYQSAKTVKNVQKGSLDTFTLFIEKGFDCLKTYGNLDYIVPIAITSSDSMTGIHKLLESSCSLIKVSSYAVRPQPVFENAVVNTSILFFQKDNKPNEHILATKMYRKNKKLNLQHLISNLQFIDIKELKLIGRYPKISLEIEKSILKKIFLQEKSIGNFIKEKENPIYYRTTGGRYFKVITNYSTGSTKEKQIYFEKKIANSIGAILSSNLYFWFYQIFSNNLDLKIYEIDSFGFPKLDEKTINALEIKYAEYLQDIEKNANIRITSEKSSYNVSEFKEYKIGKSKHLIDQIDDIICPLYGLTLEETEFIKNYEVEFRMSGEE